MANILTYNKKWFVLAIKFWPLKKLYSDLGVVLNNVDLSSHSDYQYYTSYYTYYGGSNPSQEDAHPVDSDLLNSEY